MTNATNTSQQPRRRLSSRRGSLSAPDPFALNAELETQRATASRLTIFRAPLPPQPPADNRVSRRSSWGSNHSASSTGSAGRSPGRLSFAFSSFTPIHKPEGAGHAQGQGQPAAEPARPTSPSAHRQQPSQTVDRAGLYTGRPPSLSAQQICDLAVSSIAKSQSANPIPEGPTPSSGFHALADEQYLPFLERPSEVSALISTAPTSKIMKLLQQTFSVDARAPYDPKAPQEELNADPTKWTFANLCQYLQTIERETASDRDWVLKIRACVLGHSELLWSRLKEALGVPPELEEDDDEDDEDDEGPGEFYDYEREVWLEPILPGDHATCIASPVLRPESPMSYSGRESVGMESIGEGEEEEEGNGERGSSNADVEETEQRIQGLRISTPLLEVNPQMRPGGLSPLASDSSIRRSHSMSSSQDSLVLERRNDRVRALTGTGRARRSRQQEHGTGDSLFPSSFATLTMGPSLVANNPALRAGPRRRFRPGEPLGVRHLRQNNSLSGGWDTDGNDYALSLGSGSERSFAGR
ncbi:hypothetical protein SCHPADRAFT_902193 [Schizopora paradoxa]|uniref:Uncharacterized protein n=1 Tax=Schizopora paradoxa TaxID=27342 RepID=A0A0H2SF39_9AGAM|nr:hypothetical protein SCHPADRAFT_902193 [Schizopora paradoxa]